MKLKNPLRTFIDWYVRNYQAENYIHISMIRDEISKRIDGAVKYNNKIRDEQESIKIKALELQFKIQEEGWCAEIINMEKTVSEVELLRKKTMNVYLDTYRRAKELAMVTAENQHEGNKIIENVSASVGKLDIIGKNAADIVKEINDNKIKEQDALQMK